MTVLRATRATPVRAGTSRRGMDFVTWGAGSKTLLFIQGGPGSSVPGGGLALSLTRPVFSPYVAAGYRIFVVTRRRHMPDGYTVPDMADDYASAIDELLGGRADLVYGESYGGMIAQHLAARHPDHLRHLALVATGARLSAWSDEVDARLVAALEKGDTREAATVFGEDLVPGRSLAPLRRLLAPALVRRLVPLDDVLVETRADATYDARADLPRIEVPVLLVCGDRDLYFTPEIIEETAALIPDCTLMWRKGWGHLRTVTSRRVHRDVVAFVDRRESVTPQAE